MGGEVTELVIFCWRHKCMTPYVVVFQTQRNLEILVSDGKYVLPSESDTTSIDIFWIR